MAIMMNLLARPQALSVLKQARALLSDLTPLKINCGRLCDGACCKDDETGENGMLLFPFEECLYQKPIEGFAFHLIPDDTLYKGGQRLVCEGQCDREHRPLACRIFPLRMAVQVSDTEDIRVQAELDPRAFCVCPLLEQGGLRAMDKAFVSAVKEAGELLCQNTYMLEALLNEQRLMDEMRKF